MFDLLSVGKRFLAQFGAGWPHFQAEISVLGPFGGGEAPPNVRAEGRLCHEMDLEQRSRPENGAIWLQIGQGIFSQRATKTKKHKT